MLAFNLTSFQCDLKKKKIHINDRVKKALA